MTKSHSASWQKLALTALLGLGSTGAFAQTLNYNLFGGTSNAAGTYTDLGTTGTVITTPDNDDANSAATPIGFTFNFNGTAFTDFVLNTNGYLRLGTTAPAAPYFYSGPQVTTGGPLNTATETNLILPLNLDLEGTATTEYRVATTGTAGTRVTTIQWEDVSDKVVSPTTGKQFASISFQVKLYEGTNQIDLIYGPSTAGPGPDAFKSAAIGIKGSGNTATTSILLTKGSAQAWSAATFRAGNYVGNAHNVRSTVRPDVGRTYTFLPQAANDAATTVIYTLGKIPTTNGPHAVSAYVRNVGTNNLTNVAVNLNVTGSNPFTDAKVVPALSVGDSALVTFAPYTVTTAGTNTIAVFVGNDDRNPNNTRIATQQVTTNVLSYADNSPISTGVGGPGARLLISKHAVSQSQTVTSVAVTLFNDPSNVGRTVYGVVLNAAGSVVAQSAPVVLTQADLGSAKSFTMTTAPVIPAGTFFAGLAQTTQTGTGSYFPIAIQAETPTRIRPDTAYFVAGLTGSLRTPSLFGRFMTDVTLSTAVATCQAPTGVTVTNPTTTGARVTFTGPANATGYTIIYGAPGFNPATGGTSVPAAASPFTLTGLTVSTNYQLYVRANCGATDQSTLAGPITFSTTCPSPIITTFPFVENFDGVPTGSLPCGFTVANTNGDSVSWRNRATVPGLGGPIVVAASAPNAMTYYFNEDATTAADDWFFTPALFLTQGNTYKLSFQYRNSGTNFRESLEVKYGATAAPAGQTTTIWSNTAIGTTTFATANETSTPAVLNITPTTTGTYFVGFHVFSPADRFFLAVDNLSITAGPLSASSALNRAVSLFPNPTTGLVKLDVRGANAKGNLKVDVVNMLGQTVHTAALKDNFENQLNLSNLANGMYLLKVQTGSDFTTRQLTIAK